LLEAASRYIKREAKKLKKYTMLEVLEVALDNLKVQEFLRDEEIPVVCISAIDRDHLEIPQEFVGLLMTLRYQDAPDKVLASLEKIGSDPGEIFLH